jgi:hypothetical protein
MRRFAVVPSSCYGGVSWLARAPSELKKSSTSITTTSYCYPHTKLALDPHQNIQSSLHSLQQTGEVEASCCHLPLHHLEPTAVQGSLYIRLGVKVGPCSLQSTTSNTLLSIVSAVEAR